MSIVFGHIICEISIIGLESRTSCWKVPVILRNVFGAYIVAEVMTSIEIFKIDVLHVVNISQHVLAMEEFPLDTHINLEVTDIKIQ